MEHCQTTSAHEAMSGLLGTEAEIKARIDMIIELEIKAATNV